MQILCRIMIFKRIVIMILYCVASLASAQSKMLLEACNALENRDKRMECLKELMQQPVTKNDAKSAQTVALKRTKAVFAATASAVQLGISYNNYSILIMDPAKELGVLRQEALDLDPGVLEKLSEAVAAYNDAATVWAASIFRSRDAGLFGRVLDPDQTGLTSIVRRYHLSTTSVFLGTHLPLDAALSSIWRSAEMSAKNAFNMAEGLPLNSPEAVVVCDKWGNPQDIHGNPCVQD